MKNVIKILIMLVVTFFAISCTDKKKENDKEHQEQKDLIEEDVFMHHNHQEGRTHDETKSVSKSSDTIKDIKE
ncbi:hypothetical protein G3567_09815 [Psychroflexus sp. YR1-1]|uniref:Lipoprotein n=1 Tax=Psychroflexus aurantiacus TaxID=2709310 RepID=A0A6B3R5P6_9FLAO|nr:hypothetical protein [Psychroflexus aurantiacus]NEV94437.1 hypothetical protein [Psychroflexus aurantiacus]